MNRRLLFIIVLAVTGRVYVAAMEQPFVFLDLEEAANQ